MAFLLLGAQGASASSGSLTVADAGGRSMSVTAEATVDVCSSQPCPWLVTIRERHASLPCANDNVFNVGIVGAEAQPGTARRTLTFQPFFPRSAKLCLYAFRPLGGGTELLAEATYRVPRGYGYRRGTTYACSSFKSQAAAQYYLYLYPEDPSQLDPDRNGLACEDNPCPCAAERIPAEPAEVHRACKKARSRQRQAGLAVKAAQRRLRKADNPVATRRWNRRLKGRRAALRKAKQRARKACRPAAAKRGHPRRRGVVAVGYGVGVDSERARQLLAAEREQLERELANLERQGPEGADARREPGDYDSEGLYQDEFDAGRADDLKERLGALERAEARLAEGTYGRSVRSGEPIPDERLEANPTAELTVEEAGRG